MLASAAFLVFYWFSIIKLNFGVTRIAVIKADATNFTC